MSGMLDFLDHLQPLMPIALVTDGNVCSLHGEGVAAAIRERGFRCEIFSFPAGEMYKTRATKEFLENQMFEAGMGRNTVLVGLGGGVTLDIAGFLASTYCRGIPFVSLPTSLLAMVDAAFGGKNGVNTPYGKNLVGTLYEPIAIHIHTPFLQTLPKDDYRQGIAEMVKHAACFSEPFFSDLEQNVDAILARDLAVMERMLETNRAMKERAVLYDRIEPGSRDSLNFGHTLGHALETASDYSLQHGDAIAWGMVWESTLGMRAKGFPVEDLHRLTELLHRFGFFTKLPPFDRAKFFEALWMDKKRGSAQQGIPLVLLRCIGQLQNRAKPLFFLADSYLVQEVIEEPISVCSASR